MAWPAPGTVGVTPTWDKTAGTFKTEIDQKLWAALMAKSPILDMVSRPSVSNFEFKWETDVAPTRLYTAASATAASSSSATGITLAAAPKDLEVGSIIRNYSRPTPIGSFGQDELMEVVDISTAVLTVVRDVGGANSGAGSTAHVATDTFEVVYAPREEGSGPGVNRYKDVQLVTNVANSLDFYLTVTGDQAATAREVAGDTLANQTQKNMTKLQNDIEAMLFYGAYQAGSASAVRRTRGIDYFVGASNGNVDVTSREITPAALDGLFYKIIEDNSDPNDRYIIACHPWNAMKVSSFGMDKVRYGQEETKYGRYIDTFKSAIGVEAPIIWTLNLSKSDLFIIDMDKVELPVFRPFEKAEWSYGDDGVDAWRQRYLTSIGVKVVDGLYSHAKLGLLPWS